MMFCSHIKIAKYFFRHIKDQDNLMFKLNKASFIYGSVKPDVTEMVKIKHDYKHTKSIYIEYLNIANNPLLDDKVRSEALGVVYHFICDYFCKYHSKAPYNEYSLFSHFLYELKLHMTLNIQLATKWLRGQHHLKIPFNDSRRGDLDFLLCRYLAKKESTLLDIEFTLYQLNELTESILGVKAFVYELKEIHETQMKDPAYELDMEGTIA